MPRCAESSRKVSAVAGAMETNTQIIVRRRCRQVSHITQGFAYSAKYFGVYRGEMLTEFQIEE